MVRQLRHQLREILENAGISNAALEADFIVADVLSCSKEDILLGSVNLQDAQVTQCVAIATKRATGYPLQYLLGSWEFYGISFRVGEGVLIPRQDTETLCDTAIDVVGNHSFHVLDLCTGSGCITISVAKRCPNATFTVVENAPAAITYLLQNLKDHQVEASLLTEDVLTAQTAQHCPMADVILSNPPYLTAKEMEALQLEVTHEPKEALYGGPDGLQFYQVILQNYKSRLKPGGTILLELGSTQCNAVTTLLHQYGYGEIEVIKDIQGYHRVLCAKNK